MQFNLRFESSLYHKRLKASGQLEAGQYVWRTVNVPHLFVCSWYWPPATWGPFCGNGSHIIINMVKIIWQFHDALSLLTVTVCLLVHLYSSLLFRSIMARTGRREAGHFWCLPLYGIWGLSFDSTLLFMLSCYSVYTCCSNVLLLPSVQIT